MRLCDKCRERVYTSLVLERDEGHYDLCSAHYTELIQWLSNTERAQNSAAKEQAVSTPPATPKRRGRPPGRPRNTEMK